MGTIWSRISYARRDKVTEVWTSEIDTKFNELWIIE